MIDLHDLAPKYFSEKRVVGAFSDPTLFGEYLDVLYQCDIKDKSHEEALEKIFAFGFKYAAHELEHAMEKSRAAQYGAILNPPESEEELQKKLVSQTLNMGKVFNQKNGSSNG